MAAWRVAKPAIEGGRVWSKPEGVWVLNCDGRSSAKGAGRVASTAAAMAASAEREEALTCCCTKRILYLPMSSRSPWFRVWRSMGWPLT